MYDTGYLYFLRLGSAVVIDLKFFILKNLSKAINEVAKLFQCAQAVVRLVLLSGTAGILVACCVAKRLRFPVALFAPTQRNVTTSSKPLPSSPREPACFPTIVEENFQSFVERFEIFWLAVRIQT